MQAALGSYIFRRRREWNIAAYNAVSIRLANGAIKIPDLCILFGPRPDTAILETPPLVVIEILSPEDRPVRVDRNIAEWLAFGVPYVWVIDPDTRESMLHTPQGRIPVEDGWLRIPGTPIEIPLAQVDQD
jgi:Uma2 family endonuclease